MNNEENMEAKRQLKQMEMNILSINSNSFQSNNGSDEDLPSNLSILTNNGNNNNLKDKQVDNEDNSSNHSGENLINNSSNNSSNLSNLSNNKPTTRNRRKSVPYKVPSSKMNSSPNDTEEDDNSLKSDQTSIKEDDETCSNNDLNE